MRVENAKDLLTKTEVCRAKILFEIEVSFIILEIHYTALAKLYLHLITLSIIVFYKCESI